MTFRALSPNPIDYAAAVRDFSWDRARGWLDGLPGGAGLNIAHEAVDRHAASARRNHVALRWRGRHGAARDITYAELAMDSARFANVLDALRVKAGETVFALLPRIPELYISALGTLKHRSIFCPLFSAFGPEPLRERLERGNAAVLVTTEALYRRKVVEIRGMLPALRHVLVVAEQGLAAQQGEDYRALLAAAPDEYAIAPTDPDEPALLHFTSGTTGRPKGALHVHKAVVAHHATARFALDLRPDDVFWCTADPGWVTGTSYGLVAPLTLGLTSIVDEADFDAARWYQVLQDEAVTVWYTAPTAIRLLMRAGPELASRYDLSALRLVASVGEPLSPDAVRWAQETWRRPVLDNWWQTETGGIMVSNFLGMEVRPGSMGRPLPGIDVALIERAPDGLRFIESPGEQGEIALRAGWPSMFSAYFGNPERYAACFAEGWYLTGDLATRDADGYFWFVGRADDVIKSAGHLIGPFEVESALTEHAAVAEAAVIGKPHPLVGEVVKAFVVLHPDVSPSPDLERDILAHARVRLGAQIAPKELSVVAELPHTRSGKVMRRLLRARELGLPEGDLSMLERAGTDTEEAP